MIVFDLKCRDGHVFEEWFASTADYDEKVASTQLVCPTCGDTHIEKGLTAPRINGGGAAEPMVGPCGQAVCGTSGCQMMAGG